MNKVLKCITIAVMMHGMTTKNPRLTITLQPSVAAQLRELSRLTGNSQSYLIADLLDGSQPVFDRVIKVLTAAEDAKQAIKGKVAADLEAAQANVEEQLGLRLEVLDDATDSLLVEAERIKRRSRKATGGRKRSAPPGCLEGAPKGTPTPLSNRGVRYTKTTTKTIAKKQAPTKENPEKQGVKTRGGRK